MPGLLPMGVEIVGPGVPGAEAVLTPEALAIVAGLQRRFGPTREAILAPGPTATVSSRQAPAPASSPKRPPCAATDWRVAEAPADLNDRRVEITGPAEPKMMINALNSGARVFMADLEDALSPDLGQRHRRPGGPARRRSAGRSSSRRPRARRTGSPSRPPRSSSDRVAGTSRSATCTSTGDRSRPACSTSACTWSTTAPRRSRAGTGPYSTCRSWRATARRGSGTTCSSPARRRSASRRGSIRATVLIETIFAAFEMDEILYELREHAAGLNAGRWDYIFSLIKTFRDRPGMALPDRGQVTMAVPFMRAYTQLLVRTCHRRGAHAIGGMSAFIPNRREPEMTANAPGPGARGQGARGGRRLRRHMGRPSRPRSGRGRGLRSASSASARTRRTASARTSRSNAGDLLDVTDRRRAGDRDRGPPERQRRARYLDAWLRGTGAAAIDNLMEDAATAEISRSQLWQWRRHGTTARRRPGGRRRAVPVDPGRGAGTSRRAGDRSPRRCGRPPRPARA